MSAIEELMVSLEDETFEAIFEGMLFTLDKNTLAQLAKDMEAREQSVADEMKRKLFNKGITYLKKHLENM